MDFIRKSRFPRSMDLSIQFRRCTGIPALTISGFLREVEAVKRGDRITLAIFKRICLCVNQNQANTTAGQPRDESNEREQ